jgi:hypothetical protein
MADLAKRKKR